MTNFGKYHNKRRIIPGKLIEVKAEAEVEKLIDMPIYKLVLSTSSRGGSGSKKKVVHRFF